MKRHPVDMRRLRQGCGESLWGRPLGEVAPIAATTVQGSAVMAEEVRFRFSNSAGSRGPGTGRLNE